MRNTLHNRPRCARGESRLQPRSIMSRVTRKVIRESATRVTISGLTRTPVESSWPCTARVVTLLRVWTAMAPGDQGLMFGYACNQTAELMPVPIAFSHRNHQSSGRSAPEGVVNWLRPDSKSQVTVEYDGSKPVRIDAIVVSTQHADTVFRKRSQTSSRSR